MVHKADTDGLVLHRKGLLPSVLEHFLPFKKQVDGGTRVVPSVEHLTLDLGSGRNLIVHEIEFHVWL